MGKIPSIPPHRISGARCHWVAVTAALVFTLCPTQAAAQAPAAPTTAAAVLPAEELEQLVGRIALYPDDLVAIILPASTQPVQIVQAQRFLDKRKQDPKSPVNEKWDDAVKALLNYPELLKMMSDDLDWTAALGEAVATDTAEVMEAVQAFRRRTQSAGNLKSDDKQTIVVEQEIIKIQPANPEVVYVPQYNPTTVVYAGYTWGYYPAPYPAYWYPYAPGAAFAAGVVWGAALGAIWGGGHYNCGWGGGGNYNININRGGNTSNIGSGNRGGAATQWKSSKQPGQVASGVGRTPPSTRMGDARGGAGAAGGARPSTQPAAGAARPSAGTADRGGTRASTSPARGGSAGASTSPARGGAFDGAGSSARQTSLNSSRGASSRGTSSAGRASAAPRSAPSGGGARGGGGGGRGGGRR